MEITDLLRNEHAKSGMLELPLDFSSRLAIGAFPARRDRDFWIRSMQTIPITGKRVRDARVVAVLHNPLPTIRQLP